MAEFPAQQVQSVSDFDLPVGAKSSPQTTTQTAASDIGSDEDSRQSAEPPGYGSGPRRLRRSNTTARQATYQTLENSFLAANHDTIQALANFQDEAKATEHKLRVNLKAAREEALEWQRKYDRSETQRLLAATQLEVCCFNPNSPN